MEAKADRWSAMSEVTAEAEKGRGEEAEAEEAGEEEQTEDDDNRGENVENAEEDI